MCIIDVICIDGSRVILKNHSTDYIHANYVRGDPLVNTFICTQGPMMDTVKDFWFVCLYITIFTTDFL